jgi:hypothetical protein
MSVGLQWSHLNGSIVSKPACYNSTVMTFMVVTYELQRPLRTEQLRSLGEFANTYGLQRFRLDADGKHVQFEYDASRLTESVVENVLRAAKIAVIRKLEAAPSAALPAAAPPPAA